MLEDLKVNDFDIIIIGGGITGAGVARDASLRGFDVALLEKQDFASGTSSMTSKMLHGGLRYLRNYEFRLVREAALERKVHLNIAPHLSEVMRFLLPVYRWSEEGKFKLRLGLILYDLMAFPKGIGRHEMVSKEKLIEKLPLLENDDLVGGAMYNDVKTNDARLTLSNVLSAHREGATVLNYTMVTSWEKVESGVRVQVRNMETGDQFWISGKTLIICGGPWTEIIENRASNYEGKAKLRTTWGTHLVLKKRLKDNPCLLVNEDDRPVFLIPRLDYDLAGTTDVDYEGHPDQITPTKEDINYILNACNLLFPTAKYSRDDVVAAFTGLRPLVYEKGVLEGDVSRDHKIFNDKEAIITLVGGKLTTYRVMAKEAIDKALKLLDLPKRDYECMTKTTPLHGGDIPNWETFFEEKTRYLVNTYGLDEKTARVQVQWYGSELTAFENVLAEHGMAKLKSNRPWMEAQVLYSCRYEFCRNPIDFLRRRTPIMLEEMNGEDVLHRVVDLMATEFDWDEEVKAQMKDDTLNYINKFIRVQLIE